MSIKDVKKYYDQITADYSEMIESLKEMEELAAQQVVNPDRVEELRKAVEPLKNNYMRISYIMFLLNMPNKKEKKERYKKQQAKFLKNIELDQTEHEENKKVINTLNDVWTGKLEEKENE